jgi:hypothetical protein
VSFSLALFLAQAVVRVSPPEPALPPSDPAAAFALFKTVCFDPYPDTRGFTAAMAGLPQFVQWQPTTDIERLIPGKTWHSQTARVQYWERPGVLPPPQCQVFSTAPAGTEPEQLFPRLAASLGLARGRISGNKRNRTAMWDLEQLDGTRWRVILGTRQQDGQMQIRLSILNLGDED